MNVFLTIDTEFWPENRESFGPLDVQKSLARWVYCQTKSGEFGVPFLLDQFQQYGLKATFFVEGLSASVVGWEPIKQVVHLIHGGGQEVQLHAHPEWLQFMETPLVPEPHKENLGEYSLSAQEVLIAKALDNLTACGAQPIRAFRAGNYGADINTLRALRNTGILFDTSYNQSYLGKSCFMELDQPLLQPARLENIIEIPISQLRETPGGFRHVQLCACSFAEISSALLQAHTYNWHSFVIVLHSFELLTRRRNDVDKILVRRFIKLCRFLQQHRNKFQTRHFSTLEPREILNTQEVKPLVLPVGLRIQRYVEQFRRGFY